ncbi:MAG: hypothetical protein Q7T07_16605 [Burkholderiaceae bacterium]|nr:hypothetical protein [Burkholderiaceae bacterium]
MKLHHTITIGLFMCIGCAAVTAAQLTCYSDPRTDATQCFDPKQVREKDGIRYTDYYSGGPKGVDKTSFTIHVNCSTNVIHMKDRKGVSFAGGSGSATEASRSLRTWICEAKPIGAKIVKK